MADRLGLSKGQRFPVKTANGTSYAYSTLLELLEMGEISFSNIRASLNPGLTGNEILLGMNVLKQMEIIQRDNLLILRR